MLELRSAFPGSEFRGRTSLDRALTACRKQFIAVGVFSGVVNVLQLTTSIYMMQVFDRVLATRVLETLVYLSVLARAPLRANDDETSTPREFRPAGAEGSSRSCPCFSHRSMPRRVAPRTEAGGRRSWRHPPRHLPNYRTARADGPSPRGTSYASSPRPTAPLRPAGSVRSCAARASTHQPFAIGAGNATQEPPER